MQKAIDATISTWPEENPQLIGSGCGACGATVFPRQSHCPKCSKAEMSDVLLPRRGTVIAWTTQGLRRVRHTPVRRARTSCRSAVGLVQLGDVVRVEGRLTENDPAKLSFGMEVELTMIPFATDAEGNEVVTFAFQPV